MTYKLSLHSGLEIFQTLATFGRRDIEQGGGRLPNGLGNAQRTSSLVLRPACCRIRSLRLVDISLGVLRLRAASCRVFLGRSGLFRWLVRFLLSPTPALCLTPRVLAQAIAEPAAPVYPIQHARALLAFLRDGALPCGSSGVSSSSCRRPFVCGTRSRQRCSTKHRLYLSRGGRRKSPNAGEAPAARRAGALFTGQARHAILRLDCPDLT